MADVFVSYKAEDRRRVKPLVEALQAEGYSVWWDEQIGGGAAWRQAIETEFNAAKCVIVVWSNRSVGPYGAFVQDEATRAQQRHVYVPVLIDKVHLPLGFGETQALPLTGWHGNRADPRYEAVLSAVARNLGAKRRTSPVGQPVMDRRTLIAGSGLAAVAVAAVGAWAFLKSGPGSACGSIAVLPFENLSGDPGQAYFSDGIAEEIRSALARIAGLKVVARTSSEAVRDEDVKTAAHKLDVGNILTGSVRRSPNTIRVSAQLVDGGTGLERWSQTLDRPVGDTLAIQTNIAESVADALSIELGNAGKAALALGGTRNAAAHDLVLQVDPGRSDDGEQGLLRALAALDTAIQLDPNYAEAYAKKALTLNYYASTFSRTPADMDKGIADAKAAAQRAIAIAPQLPMGHAALATVLKNRQEFRAAFTEQEKAAHLPGADFISLRNYAVFLAQIGRYDEAVKDAASIVPLDPLSPGTFETQSQIFFNAHRFAEGLNAARRSIELGPNRFRPRSFVGYCLYGLRRYGEAKAEFERLPADDAHRLMGLASIAAVQGDRATSDTLLNQLKQRYGDGASYQLAEVYAQRQQADLAIEALRKAVQIRDPGLVGMKSDAYLDPVRNDSRFADIVRQLDFPT